MRFNKSAVEYATHNLSLYYGECPHNCSYCYVDLKFRKRKIPWSVGELRANPKAFTLAREASKEGVNPLVVSFTSDPLPFSQDRKVNERRIKTLMDLLAILEEREIPTKVLTKNAQIMLLGANTEPYEHIQIGLSLTTDSQNIFEFENWEKGTTSIQSRLVALNYLKTFGFRLWVSMEPILPKTQIFSLLKEAQSCYPEEIWIGKGNYIPALENAFDWTIFVEQILSRNKKNIHLKQELVKASKLNVW